MSKKNNDNREMFDSISEEYDFINNLITFGAHNKWKKKIVNISKKKNPKKILDLATGTSDIAIELSSIKNCKIIGVDPSSKMLEVGQKKINNLNLNENILLEKGDAEKLKYNSEIFDVVTIGYGVRNFTNLKNSLKEIYRVLKNNGISILQVPININREKTFEDPKITSISEREKHFGQYDHVREYGIDYKSRIEEVGFIVEMINYTDNLSEDTINKYGLLKNDLIPIAKKIIE